MRILCQHVLKPVVGRTSTWSRIAMVRGCHSDASSYDLEELFKGNQGYMKHMSTHHPKLLEQLAREGQRTSSFPLDFQVDVQASFQVHHSQCSNARTAGKLNSMPFIVHHHHYLPYRLSEQAIFNTKPGTIFTTRNIANIFVEDDVTSSVHSTLPLFLSLNGS